MTNTLILIFHRDLSKSKANAALAEAAQNLPGTEIVDVQSLYPDGDINMGPDATVEIARLLAADRIVLQFPIQWYATPALLKTWLDSVLTRMFYINYANEGRLLEGKSVMVAATAGNIAASYAPTGQNRVPIGQMLMPLRMMANRCGLTWIEPFIVFEADKLSPERLDQAGQDYVEALLAWKEGESLLPPKTEAKPEPVAAPHDTLVEAEKGTPIWFSWAARVLPVGVLGQFLLAGAGLFWNPDVWSAHGILGASLSLPILALGFGVIKVKRLRGFNWWSLLCLILYGVQVWLAAGHLHGSAPASLALHPFNGALLLSASLVLLAKVERRLRKERQSPVADPQAPTA